MKKILALLLTLSMVFALTACGSGQEDESSQEEPNTTEEGSNLVGVAMPTKDLQRWNQDGENMKAQLRKAQHYIFLEYFIVEDGKMWGEILEILRQKAAQGVDVRLIYDDLGCVMTLPYR